MDGGDLRGPTGFAKGGFGDPPLARHAGAKPCLLTAQPHLLPRSGIALAIEPVTLVRNS